MNKFKVKLIGNSLLQRMLVLFGPVPVRYEQLSPTDKSIADGEEFEVYRLNNGMYVVVMEDENEVPLEFTKNELVFID